MNDLLKWLSSGSVTANILVILVAFTLSIVILIYLIAFLQGREIFFWPPKIGERKKETLKNIEKAGIGKEELDQIRSSLRFISIFVENILQFHILEKIANEFGIKFDLTVLGDIKPEEGLPEDKDYPHILFFTVDKESVKRGEAANVLFRVADHGWNFRETSPNAIEIVDTSTMTIFSSKHIGRSYHLVQIHIPENATLGYHKIQFHLRDLKNNTFTQSMKLLVENV